MTEAFFLVKLPSYECYRTQQSVLFQIIAMSPYHVLHHNELTEKVNVKYSNFSLPLTLSTDLTCWIKDIIRHAARNIVSWTNAIIFLLVSSLKIFQSCFGIWMFLSLKLVQGPLQWRHNWCDCVSNQQPHDCLLNRLFRRTSKKTPKLRITGLCAGNSPVIGDFPNTKGQ